MDSFYFRRIWSESWRVVETRVYLFDRKKLYVQARYFSLIQGIPDLLCVFLTHLFICLPPICRLDSIRSKVYLELVYLQKLWSQNVYSLDLAKPRNQEEILIILFFPQTLIFNIFLTQYCMPQIFQTRKTVRLNTKSLRYWVGKMKKLKKFVSETQFL